MTRPTARPVPFADYVLVATGQVDPFVPSAPVTAPADVIGTAPRPARRRGPYMYTSRLGSPV